MRRSIQLGVVAFIFCSLLRPPLHAQQSAPAQIAPTAPQRDPQAVAILGQALGLSGGAAAFGQVKDFTATGNITYFWAGEQVTGAVTLRGRGVDQFRLDASLPQGTRSWTVSDGQGSISEPTGRTSLIPPSNGLNLGALTLPFLGVFTALTDPTVSISPAAQVTLAGKPAYDVRVQRTFTQKDDPTGELSKWSAKDYLIDVSTLTLVGTRDTAFPNDAPKQGFVHEIIFSDYRTTNGMLVPFSITEKIASQHTWVIQLSAINFNTGLTDANFKP
jgi:hypothetical protein